MGGWKTDWRAGDLGHVDVHRAIGRRLNTVVNVKDPPWSAKGDGAADDLGALRAAFAAGAGSVVYVPAGDYLMRATEDGIIIPANTRVEFAPGTTLRLMPNALLAYSMLNVAGHANIEIVGGGRLFGDGDQHQGGAGYNGVGLMVSVGSGVIVRDLCVENVWGDGIYIGYDATDVLLDNCRCVGNRRNGLTVSSSSSVTVRGGHFDDNGQCGIDVETDVGSRVIQDVRLCDCGVRGNAHNGVNVAADGGNVEQVRLAGVRSYENGKSGIMWARARDGRIVDCRAYDNTEMGILCYGVEDVIVAFCAALGNNPGRVPEWRDIMFNNYPDPVARCQLVHSRCGTLWVPPTGVETWMNVVG